MYSLLLLKNSEIKNETQLPKHQVGYISSIGTENMSYAVAEIQKNVGNINLKDNKDFKSLLSALYNKNVDAILLDEAFRSLVEQEKDTFSDDTRVIYQVTKDEEAVSSKSVY